jgi:hypothetical protein
LRGVPLMHTRQLLISASTIAVLGASCTAVGRRVPESNEIPDLVRIVQAGALSCQSQYPRTADERLIGCQRVSEGRTLYLYRTPAGTIESAGWWEDITRSSERIALDSLAATLGHTADMTLTTCSDSTMFWRIREVRWERGGWQYSLTETTPSEVGGGNTSLHHSAQRQQLNCGMPHLQPPQGPHRRRPTAGTAGVSRDRE